MTREVTTYQDLLDALLAMPPAQRQQTIQIFEDDNSLDVQELKPGICIGTVEDLGIDKCRSSDDNAHHENQVVLVIAGNPYSPSGVMAWDLETSEATVSGVFDWTEAWPTT